MVLIVSGSELYEPLGEFHDYCPVHRGIHTFERKQIRRKAHLQGLTIGSRAAVSQIATGLAPCRYTRPIDAPLIDSAPTEERWARRLVLEAELRHNPAAVPVEQRVKLFRETVFALEDAYVVPEKTMTRAMALGSVFGLTALVLSVIAGVLGVPWSTMGWLIVGSLVSTFLGPIVANQLTDSRHKRGDFSVLAATALRPLALDQTTISSELRLAKQNGSTLTRRLSRIDLTHANGLLPSAASPIRP